jgi:hypothetical protein
MPASEKQLVLDAIKRLMADDIKNVCGKGAREDREYVQRRIEKAMPTRDQQQN